MTDGPFTESKEIVGGFALIQAKSKEEAVEFTKRFLKVAGDGETEIRQLYEQPANSPAGSPPNQPRHVHIHAHSRRRQKMRFMAIIKATKESEGGGLPDPQLMAEMGKYNEELMKAGVLLAMRWPPSQLQRRTRQILRQVSYRHRRPLHRNQGTRRRLLDLQVKSLEEAIEWVKRSPHAGDCEVEIRQVFEMEDFAPILSEEQIQHKVRAPSCGCQIGPPKIASALASPV